MKKNILYTFLLLLLLFFFTTSYSSRLYCFQDSTHSRADTSIINSESVFNNPDDSTKPKYYFGTASFYSRSLEGTKTSNDETFRHSKLTAASNKFKLGTWLRVTNLTNGRSIVVRVNDRMHPRMARKGRIVDLSYTGAKKLNFVKKGITRVKVEVVPKGTRE